MEGRPKYISDYRKFGDPGTGNRGTGKGYLDHLVVQIFVSLVIVALVLFLNNIKTELTQSITQGIKATISWNVDLGKTIDTFTHFKSIIPTTQQDTQAETGKKTAENPFNSTITTSSSEFIMPIEGEITSAFGMREHPVFKTNKMHNGIDINAPIGTPFKASMSGKVTKVGKDDTSGKYVTIVKGDYQTFYAHCLSISVKEGQNVKQGDIIGETGDTGVVSGPHLHFEISKDGKPMDPTEIVKEEKLQ